MTLGSLWNYYRDEIDGVDDNASDGKSFKHETTVVGKRTQRPAWPGSKGDINQLEQADIPTVNVDVTIQLKYLSDFWRLLN